MVTIRIILTLFFCNWFLWESSVWAAEKPSSEHYRLKIKKTDQPVIIDGNLDESCWLQAEKANRFWQNFPFDTSEAKTLTVAMVSFDKKNLYVAAICLDTLQGDYVIQSLKRDFSYPVSDAFTIIFDPFQDKTNGFAFGVNALGAQREGLVANGGNFGVTTDWDNKWFSAVKHHKDRWVVEMAIPFKSIRYKTGLKEWGINFARNDLKRNEGTTWFPVPRIFNIATLNFTGTLEWLDPPPDAGSNVSIIPYLIAGPATVYHKNTQSQWTRNAGLDAKVAVTPSLNLDLTINPDFAQVEVDRQQVNLTRFNLFFPEKRIFFLENSDLFGQFGFRQIRPFFSRQIGLYQDETLTQPIPIPILGGARLSGKINKNWRIGLMDVQTGVAKFSVNGKDINSPRQNFAVLALQRQIFKTSNIAFIAVNKQNSAHEYNRVFGLDYNLLSSDNRWKGKFFYHRSFSSIFQNNQEAVAHASFLNYSTPTFFFSWNHEYVGKQYLAETGFVPRQNIAPGKKMTYTRFEPNIGFRIYPKSKKWNRYINNVYFDLYHDSYLDSVFKFSDILIQPNAGINFLNTSTLTLYYNLTRTRLLFPSIISGIQLPAGIYDYQNVQINWQSNKRKKLGFLVNASTGGFFNFQRHSISTDISYRTQPYGILTLNGSYDYLQNKNGQINRFYLAGFKAEMTFTRAFFLTSYIQYNPLRNNINLNIRLQYRYAPMSDLFIVYSDNYDQFWGIKDRSILVKALWWLTL